MSPTAIVPEPARASADPVVIERLGSGEIHLRMTCGIDREAGEWLLTLSVGGRRASLSEVLPILGSLGVEVLDERPYTVDNSSGMRCWIYEFGIRFPATLAGEAAQEDPTFAARCTETIAAIWNARAEADKFNELVPRAGLGWRAVSVLRAYANYLRQAGFPYSLPHIAGVLGEYPGITRMLVDLFRARFDPDLPEPRVTEPLLHAVSAECGAVPGLDADRILRAFLGLVDATVRTNFFVHPPTADRSTDREYLSFKFDSQRIAQLPQPRPRFEVYVHSPWMEGVHLRFGRVARGGLRWSDRREDFRTEVLGLVKAQAVKNSVIVPVGAKGGFVVKRPPAATGSAAADRDAYRAEGVRCYRLFISGLLDLTDNIDLAGGAVIPPARVVDYDGPDTYLVVAADKGTATFSDIANDVAAQYGFWLADAFASGGSVGYDHKALGITAKGAWESVRQHFREIDLDPQSRDFTVAGIGDMSGDVFGNGMLLSRHIRLIAAFDHRHIFLDPNPDAAVSFAERARLAALPRSSWNDYSADLISPGGGVWDRSRKAVPISEPVRQALGLPDGVAELPPPELVQAILRAPVDLLWNGGIGTYVKASTESQLDVGDKSNDPVRIDATQLRARVVVEGGNLGCTQLGRIEYARAGGRINTDALDNSAGVDCSDHEVNIKILLDAWIGAGALTSEERAPLLAAMAPEVLRLVLADNDSQNDLMGFSRATAATSIAVHGRLIDHLVRNYGVDRALEVLPGAAEITARQRSGQGLTSPELAILAAHTKLALKSQLLSSDLPDLSDFTDVLADYFPEQLRGLSGTAVEQHPLRREIIATTLANRVVDRGGITYAFRLHEEIGATDVDAVRAFAIVTEIFQLPDLWRIIRESRFDAAVTNDLNFSIRRLVDRSARWLLTRRPQPLAVHAEIDRFRDRIAEFTPYLGAWLHGDDANDLAARTAAMIGQGVPAELAHTVQVQLDQFGLLDVVEIADLAGRGIQEVGELYYLLCERIGLVPLLVQVSRLEKENRWNALARLSLRDELYDIVRAVCLDILTLGTCDGTAADKIAEWQCDNTARLLRTSTVLDAIEESGQQDLAALSVATRQLRAMVR